MRVLLILVSLMVFSAVCEAGAERVGRPNVLFVTVDDLNDRMSTYGFDRVQTPNIDRLAGRGVRFDAAYVQYPVCTPSRSSFLTGLYPDQNGVTRNRVHFRDNVPSVTTLPQLFRENGYFTARVGKIYHYDVPTGIGTNGLDDPASWDHRINPRGIDRDDDVLGNMRLIDKSTLGTVRVGGVLSWQAIPGGDELHTDAMVADSAIRLLHQEHPEKTGRPFFLGVGFYRPHVPFIAPQKYFDMHPLESIELADNPADDRHDIPVAALSDNPKEAEMSRQTEKEAIQAYYASVSFIDVQIGRLLDALDELGLRDDTLVVFLSDHGYTLGEHDLWQKGNLFEESLRTPLIVAAPGRQGNGRVSSSLVEFVDIYPTLAAMTGIAAPEYLPGSSFEPVLDDPSHEIRDSALSQAWSRAGRTRENWRDREVMGYSIRTSRYRYTEWSRGKHGVELYDHRNDPRERTNLAGEPELRGTQGRLASELRVRVKSARQQPQFPPGNDNVTEAR